MNPHSVLWRSVIALTILAAPGLSSGQEKKASLALVGGRILTLEERGEIASGTVLIEGGKIVAVGADVEVPDGTDKIDVSGLVVAPGLIDVRSALWLEPNSVRQTGTDASLDIVDGIDPYAEDWVEVAAQGVTAVYVQPAPTGRMGGRGAVLRVGPATDPESLVLRRDAGLQASLGLGRAGNARDRYSEYEQLKKVLDGARKYQEEWKKYEEALKKAKSGEGEKKDEAKPEAATPTRPDRTQMRRPGGRPSGVRPGGPGGRPPGFGGQRRRGPGGPVAGPATAEKPASTEKKSELKKPDRDPVKEMLVKVLDGEIPLRIEVHHADDAANALKLAEEFKCRFVLEGLADLDLAWESVRESRPPLVAGPVLELESVPSYRSRRRSGWFEHVAASENNLVLATFSASSRASRFLRAQAAAAISQGLSEERALEAITINAARIIGLGEQLGSIRKGKQADVVVFAGHPLDPAAPVRLTVSKGEVVYRDDESTAVSTPSRGVVSGLPPELPARYSIRTDRLLSAEGTFQPGAVVVNDGRVEAVHAGDGVPADAPVYDLGTAVVTPGLVVPHTDLGMGSLVDDSSEADAAHIRSVDGFDPMNRSARRLARAGFTTLALAPGSVNVIAGQIGCVRVGAGQPVDAECLAAKFVVGATSRNTNRYPATLVGQLKLVDECLSGSGGATDLFAPAAVQRLLLARRAELMASVREGKTVAVFHAETDAEIHGALRLIEQHNLRATLLHAREFGPYIDDLKRLGVGIIARPIRTTDYNWYAADLVRASKAGVPVTFDGNSPETMRLSVALAVNAGMSSENALKAVTTNAAAMCGLAGGTLKAGGPADFVVWTGSPVDLSAQAAHVVVDGGLMKETP